MKRNEEPGIGMSMLDIFALVASSNQMCVDIELSSEAFVRLRESLDEWIKPYVRFRDREETV